MRFGAHVSIRGHIYEAADRAARLGCECLQIFVGSPRTWREVHYLPDDLAELRRRCRAFGLRPLVAHAAYLVNLSSEGEVFERSVRHLAHALRTVEQAGGLGVVAHLGSRHDLPVSRALKRVAGAVRRALADSDGGWVLLEGSAGRTLGATFEELRAVLDALHGHPRVGVCLDTAHLFAAGWDLRTREGVEATLAAFRDQVGLGRLKLLHLNDSRADLGSGLDRHENIGEGRIGLEGFRAWVNHPELRHLCGVIETPGFDRAGPDRANLRRLKRLRDGRQEP
ncbi:MAG: deoxyribonuclease IV [Armatimonadota bacterium]|nr:deoxyribonuclease IV [Armatimonadota bacterium]MDW8156556.1 deoxyribonuclease IV [Armatimonadota bacterium]